MPSLLRGKRGVFNQWIREKKMNDIHFICLLNLFIIIIIKDIYTAQIRKATNAQITIYITLELLLLN